MHSAPPDPHPPLGLDADDLTDALPALTPTPFGDEDTDVLQVKSQRTMAYLTTALAVFVTSLVLWWSFGQSLPKDVFQRTRAMGSQFTNTKPIRVGILHSITGTMASSEKGVIDTTRMAIAELNQQGGLLGRKIQPILLDGASDPARFAQQAQRLIARHKVSALFGCWTSASRKAVLPIVASYKHLLIYPVQYEGLERSPYVFYLGAAPNQQLIPAATWAINTLKKKRFFLVGSDYVFPRAANAIVKDVLKRAGVAVVGEVYIPLGSMHVATAIRQIVATRPDVILNTLNGSTNTSFFVNLRKAKITPKRTPTISFSIAEPELEQMHIGQLVGDYAAWNYFQSLATPTNKQFVVRFKRRYGSAGLLSDPMHSAYVGVHLWAKAVRQAGSAKPAKVRPALRVQRILAPEGPIQIDAANQHAYKTARIGQIQEDGQFKVVWEATQPSRPQPFPKTRTERQWRDLLRQLQARSKPAQAPTTRPSSRPTR